MKAMAHIGVLRALEQAGIRPAGIVAVSAGSLVGAMVASGAPYERMVSIATALKQRDFAVLNRGGLMVRGIGAKSVLRPEPLRALLARVLPASFDSLVMPLRFAATDLDKGTVEVFGTAGRTDCALPEAVYASMALPLYLPPAQIGERTFGDGGLLQVLPLDLVLPGEADLVIASDVGPVAAGPRGWGGLSPALIALSDRSLAVTMADQRARTVAAWQRDPSRPPLLLVEPGVDPYGTFAFDRTVDFIEAGYRAAHAALANRQLKVES